MTALSVKIDSQALGRTNGLALHNKLIIKLQIRIPMDLERLILEGCISGYLTYTHLVATDTKADNEYARIHKAIPMYLSKNFELANNK